MIDKLRTHVILAWTITLVSSLGLVIMYKMLPGRTTSWNDLSGTVRNASATLVPTLLLMVGYFFVDDLKEVSVSPGQKTIALVLSYSYLGAVLGTTAYSLFTAELLNQTGVDHYSWLSLYQPLVVGPLFYIFGSARKATRAKGTKKTASL
jgi:hypothetical protein